MTRLLIAAGAATVFAVGSLCPFCGHGIRTASAQDAAARQATDTATVRLHISGMTCGTCATTARLALTRLQGVISATVSYQDSLGVVHYTSSRVTPSQITAHLERMTGYRAAVITEPPAQPRRER